MVFLSATDFQSDSAFAACFTFGYIPPFAVNSLSIHTSRHDIGKVAVGMFTKPIDLISNLSNIVVTTICAFEHTCQILATSATTICALKAEIRLIGLKGIGRQNFDGFPT